MSTLTRDRAAYGQAPQRSHPRVPWARVVAGLTSVGLVAGAASVVWNTQTPRSPFTLVSSDVSVPGDTALADPVGSAPLQGVPGAVVYGEEGATFGPSTGPHTLLLYDARDSGPASELYATNAAHLAAHFGPVTAQDVQRYKPGSAADYAAVVYLGTRPADLLPRAFVTDVTSMDTKVIWAGANVGELADGRALTRAQFTSRFGWDPVADPGATLRPTGVRYKNQVLVRDGRNNLEGVRIPTITDSSAVQVLAESTCGTRAQPSPCATQSARGGGTPVSTPWAIRSENLTYVGEIPFSYVGENDRMLVFADVLYDALGAGRKPVRQAALRLEDVSPISDPKAIREYADYLHQAGVPFSIAVIPRYVDPRGVYHDGAPTSIRLQDAPEVVDALRYAQERGATLIQHGTTHQFRGVDNPYTGVSAEDFEFFRAACSQTSTKPYTWRGCATDTHVQQIGSIGSDSIRGWQERIAHGRQLFVDAGLGEPHIFETPHYAASTRAYAAMRAAYDTRYERMEFSDGLLTGKPSTGASLGLFFPYSTTDVTGAKVLPENLGNYAPTSYSGHEARDVNGLIDNARANLVVTEATASLFFHPFLEKEALAQIVDGIKGLGYTFVSPAELR